MKKIIKSLLILCLVFSGFDLSVWSVRAEGTGILTDFSITNFTQSFMSGKTFEVDYELDESLSTKVWDVSLIYDNDNGENVLFSVTDSITIDEINKYKSETYDFIAIYVSYSDANGYDQFDFYSKYSEAELRNRVEFLMFFEDMEIGVYNYETDYSFTLLDANVDTTDPTIHEFSISQDGDDVNIHLDVTDEQSGYNELTLKFMQDEYEGEEGEFIYLVSNKTGDFTINLLEEGIYDCYPEGTYTLQGVWASDNVDNSQRYDDFEPFTLRVGAEEEKKANLVANEGYLKSLTLKGFSNSFSSDSSFDAEVQFVEDVGFNIEDYGIDLVYQLDDGNQYNVYVSNEFSLSDIARFESESFKFIYACVSLYDAEYNNYDHYYSPYTKEELKQLLGYNPYFTPIMCEGDLSFTLTDVDIDTTAPEVLDVNIERNNMQLLVNLNAIEMQSGLECMELSFVGKTSNYKFTMDIYNIDEGTRNNSYLATYSLEDYYRDVPYDTYVVEKMVLYDRVNNKTTYTFDEEFTIEFTNESNPFYGLTKEDLVIETDYVDNALYFRVNNPFNDNYAHISIYAKKNGKLYDLDYHYFSTEELDLSRPYSTTYEFTIEYSVNYAETASFDLEVPLHVVDVIGTVQTASLKNAQRIYNYNEYMNSSDQLFSKEMQYEVLLDSGETIYERARSCGGGGAYFEDEDGIWCMNSGSSYAYNPKYRNPEDTDNTGQFSTHSRTYWLDDAGNIVDIDGKVQVPYSKRTTETYATTNNNVKVTGLQKTLPKHKDIEVTSVNTVSGFASGTYTAYKLEMSDLLGDIQPVGDITITVSLNSGISGDNYDVFLVSKDGTEFIKDSTYDANTHSITFKANRFGTFIVTPSSGLLPPEITYVGLFTSAIEEKLNISWDTVEDVDGYEIYLSVNDEEYSLYKTITDSTIPLHNMAGIKKGYVYKVKMRSYVKENNKTKYSRFSDEHEFYYIDQVNFELSMNSINSILIEWDAVEGADGYEIYQIYKDNQIKLAETKETSYIHENVDSMCEYMYLVYPYNEYETRYVGDYSQSQRITTPYGFESEDGLLKMFYLENFSHSFDSGSSFDIGIKLDESKNLELQYIEFYYKLDDGSIEPLYLFDTLDVDSSYKYVSEHFEFLFMECSYYDDEDENYYEYYSPYTKEELSSLLGYSFTDPLLEMGCDYSFRLEDADIDTTAPVVSNFKIDRVGNYIQVSFDLEETQSGFDYMSLQYKAPSSYNNYVSMTEWEFEKTGNTYSGEFSLFSDYQYSEMGEYVLKEVTVYDVTNNKGTVDLTGINHSYILSDENNPYLDIDEDTIFFKNTMFDDEAMLFRKNDTNYEWGAGVEVYFKTKFDEECQLGHVSIMPTEIDISRARTFYETFEVEYQVCQGASDTITVEAPIKVVEVIGNVDPKSIQDKEYIIPYVDYVNDNMAYSLDEYQIILNNGEIITDKAICVGGGGAPGVDEEGIAYISTGGMYVVHPQYILTVDGETQDEYSTRTIYYLLDEEGNLVNYAGKVVLSYYDRRRVAYETTLDAVAITALQKALPSTQPVTVKKLDSVPGFDKKHVGYELSYKDGTKVIQPNDELTVLIYLDSSFINLELELYRYENGVKTKVDYGYGKDGEAIYFTTDRLTTFVISTNYEVARPLITSIERASDSSVTLKWNQVNDVKGYEICRSTDGVNYELVKTITDAETVKYTDAKLDANQEYWYKMRSYAVYEGTKMYSEYSKVERAILLSASTITAQELDYDSIVLEWQSVEKADGYEVYYSTNGKDYQLLVTVSDLFYVHDEVNTDVEYSYKVRAYKVFDNNFYGKYSNVAKVQTSLMIPEILDSELNDETFYLEWETVVGADNYEVYRATSATGKYTFLATTEKDVTNYEDTVTIGKVYFYKVRATRTNANGSLVYGKYSSVVSISNIGVPEIATKKSTDTSIAVSWNVVNGASGYEVYRSTDYDGNYTKVKTITSGKTTSWTDTKRTNGTTYFYKVKAYKTVSDKKYYGEFSEIVGFATLKTPSITVTRNGYDSIRITWKAISKASEYEVYRSTNKDKDYELIDTVSELSYVDEGLLTAKTYYYKVKAVKDCETQLAKSTFSTYKYAKTTLNTPKVTITNPGYDHILLSWDAIDGADAYEIHRSTKEKGTYTVVGESAEPTYIDNEVALGKTYYYKVKAYRNNEDDSVGYSTFSAVISKKVAIATPKVTVTNPTYEKNVLDWQDVYGVNVYEIYRATSKNGKYKPLDETTESYYEDTDVELNKTYYYKVRVVIEDDDKPLYSSYSAVVSKKVIIAVPKVTIVNLDYQTMELDWQDVELATSYQVYRATKKTGKYTKVAEIDESSYVDETVKLGTTYYYKVRVVIDDEQPLYSSYSSIVSKKVILEKPNDLYVERIDAKTALITFEGVFGADGYEIYRATSKTGKYTKVATIESTEYENTKLSNKTYYYKVRAYRLVGKTKVYSSYTSVFTCKKY